MTKSEFQFRVHQNLNDQGIFYTSIDTSDSLQDCYDEICAVTGCIMKHAIIPLIPSLTFYDLSKFIPDYLAVVAIWSSTQGMWLSPSSKREIEFLRWDWMRQNGSPLLFYPVNHRYVAIYPRPIAASDKDYLYIFYRATSSILSSNDTPLFPEEYSRVLEAASTGDLFEQQLEYTKAQQYFNIYQENLQLLDTWVKENRHPDRLFLLNVPQPTGGLMSPMGK